MNISRLYIDEYRHGGAHIVCQPLVPPLLCSQHHFFSFKIVLVWPKMTLAPAPQVLGLQMCTTTSSLY